MVYGQDGFPPIFEDPQAFVRQFKKRVPAEQGREQETPQLQTDVKVHINAEGNEVHVTVKMDGDASRVQLIEDDEVWGCIDERDDPFA
ncbi:hypothetical protein LO763_18545 [Glycomyces sp. A-F 0318]|uniref:hypothetical protein n=1 Tax=Glycomyces amatae TaxID=2881355 RepID=UPI001E2E005F|nr:hypothetical protein [Glycomyces amatae]MCD0445609.1 hypothetical protein [Glycomyces amatae]